MNICTHAHTHTRSQRDPNERTKVRKKHKLNEFIFAIYIFVSGCELASEGEKKGGRDAVFCIWYISYIIIHDREYNTSALPIIYSQADFHC